MGVSSVPGGGKTLTLSYLAAGLIASGKLRQGQEVLVVALVNSAVDNFSHRVAEFVKAKGLFPGVGYRVRTLHGLAHEIARERPALTGLSDNFQILDELAAEQILSEVIDAWVRGHPQALEQHLNPDLPENKLKQIRSYRWPELVRNVAESLIRQAKDLRLSPQDLRDRLDSASGAEPLLEMGWSIYSDYQRSLSFRGALDFADLIGKAIQALEADPDFLARLRVRWPFILEDEAQDSSRLQEALLRKLAGPEGNWVRVGDPNQAIFESFTTASPEFLRSFLKEPGVDRQDLPNSGRSTQTIIELANQLVRWVQHEHPTAALREVLVPPYIEPAPGGDPQPNPPDNPEGVKLIPLAFTSEEELEAVVSSLARWNERNKKATAAILVPTNQIGIHYAEALRQHGVPHLELLRSTHSTRITAGSLSQVIRSLATPDSTRELVASYRIWGDRTKADSSNEGLLEQAERALRSCRRPEQFLWPRLGEDWLEGIGLAPSDGMLHDHLVNFRSTVQEWHAATSLPIDQLLITLAHGIFVQPADLALAYKLAGILRRASERNPTWGLAELAGELEAVAKNERRFLGLSPDDRGFDPDAHGGEVVVSTIHKAKGLEWDRVHLVSVNNYDYPSAEPGDQFIAEKWFVRGGLNLQAEALSRLKVSGLKDLPPLGVATQSARLEYAAERLRLFYVGITRARKELIITWNTGRKRDLKQATPFAALQAGWKPRSEK